MKTNSTFATLHELLEQIVCQFGESVLAESRLNSIISDLASENTLKYQSVMSCSINNHIGQRMLALRDLDDADFSLKVSLLKQSFQEDNFLQHGIAEYVIDSYAYALGWLEHLDQYDESQDEEQKSTAGKLSFVEQADGEYCGNLNKDNERSGFGVMKKASGGYYAGEWKLNAQNGIGIFVDEDRNKYAGEWRLNRSSGVGVQVTSDGIRYAGEWKNGKLHGPVLLFYPNGERLCVRFENGKMVNTGGIFYLKDGTCVSGMMTLNGPTGICLHYYKDGTSQAEKWNNGKIEL